MADEEQAQRIHNLHPLLRWSAAQGQGFEAAGEEPQPLDAERRAFLEQVFGSLSEDFVTRMKNAMEALALHTDTADAVDKKTVALDDLMALLEDLDNARDFLVIGGVDLVFRTLDTTHPELQWRILEIFSICCQNFPELQQALAERGALPRIQTFLASAEDENVRKKALRALSCLIRGQPRLVDAFLDADGLRQLRPYMVDPQPQLRTKALFMLGGLVADAPQRLPRLLREQGLLPAVIASLGCDSAEVWEFGLRLLSLVASADAESALLLHQLGIRARLADRAAVLAALSAEDATAHEEEQAHAAALNAALPK